MKRFAAFVIAVAAIASACLSTSALASDEQIVFSQVPCYQEFSAGNVTFMGQHDWTVSNHDDSLIQVLDRDGDVIFYIMTIDDEDVATSKPSIEIATLFADGCEGSIVPKGCVSSGAITSETSEYGVYAFSFSWQEGSMLKHKTSACFGLMDETRGLMAVALFPIIDDADRFSCIAAMGIVASSMRFE